MSDNTIVIDAGDLRKYRTETPNLIDDLNLSVYAYRLYGHLKRRAGASNSVTEGLRPMAKHCQMAVNTAMKARQELIDRGLIVTDSVVNDRGRFERITIVDIWEQNFRHFAEMKRRKQGALSDGVSHDVRHGGVSPDETRVSHENRGGVASDKTRGVSPDETQRKNQGERTKEETRTHSARARESAYQRGSPPEPIVPEEANPAELPPTVEHFALLAHWKIYHVGFDIDTQTRVAAAVKDPELWREALEFWVDNDYRGRSIGKIVKKYRELEAERAKAQRGDDNAANNGKRAGGQSLSDRNEAAIADIYARRTARDAGGPT